ncbi:hypothetical protein ACIOYT_00715 [Streptomyces halstedii]|uniref:hypothetical protein n=1 Tax=Streptomyces halstedii TaxID=1944 RepID=UPI0037F4EBFA
MSGASDSRIGVTYVLTHPEYGSVKVGCTTYESRRLRDLWRRHGWVPYKHLRMASKELAESVEQGVLIHLRHRLYFPAHLNAGLTDGWTETVSARLIEAEAVWELVCEEAARLHMEPVLGAFKPTLHQPPKHHRRTKGDTPKFVRAARVEAARTARAAQVGAQNQTPRKRQASKATEKPTTVRIDTEETR